MRERFHSNLIGLHVEAGYWLTDERLRSLTGERRRQFRRDGRGAAARSAALLGGQIRQQAYTLAYMDGFMIHRLGLRGDDCAESPA